MKLKLLLALFLTAPLDAQTNHPEIEPNSVKGEATLAAGMVAGDTLTGVTTGSSATAGSTNDATVDTFRVRTAALPLGIYKHRLTLTSPESGLTGSLRGRSFLGGIFSTVDVEFQTSSTSTNPPRSNYWFGFGKQEEIYYRVSGIATTTSSYTSTLSTTPVVPTVVTSSFGSGLITISSVGQTSVDTEVFLYDAALNPIVGYHNDDEGPGGSTTQSRLVRALAPGTYFVVVSDTNVANDQNEAFFDEDGPAAVGLDFPDALAASDREAPGVDYDITISDGLATVPVTLAGDGDYDIAFARITVVPGPPPLHDTCSSPLDVTSFATGYLASATHDGNASCDGGGAGSRDLWFRFTAGVYGGAITPDTCGSAVDTVLTVFASCGGSELACNDDCGGPSCGVMDSCAGPVGLNPFQSVLLRVGDKGLSGGVFWLHTNYSANPPPNDDCTAPTVLAAQGIHPFDTTLATTGTAGQTPTPPCSAAVRKDLWFEYVATLNGTLTVSTCGGVTGGGTQDTRIALYAGSGCPGGTGIACNDDAGASCAASISNSIVTTSVTCGQVFTIQVGGASTTTPISGTFSVSETGTICSTPFTVSCTGNQVGVTCTACGNNGAPASGCANSGFAAGASLTSLGIAGVSGLSDTLLLTAQDVTGPGLFFQAVGMSAAPLGFGDGLLCATSGILRLGVVFPTAGSASFPGGLTPNPIHLGGGPLVPGDTRHYQCWYRDAAAFCTSATFNLTNALTLTWVP